MSSSFRRVPLTHALNQWLRFVLPAILLMFTASTARAQGGMTEGSRIQISAEGIKRLTGILKSRTTDSTTIFVEGTGGARQFANKDITELRVSRGRSAAAGAKKGLIWGAGVGAGLGIIQLAQHNKNDGYEYQYASDGEIATSFFIISVLFGAGLGAVTKSERWDAVQMHPAVTASSRGVGLLVAFNPAFLH